jgi:diguanylate cyclase (GGDEF)-like protein
MVLLISAELSALWFTIHTLSAVRAYVAGEGLWSKAEKDAAYHLEAYGRSRDPNEYRAYLNFLRVSLGDREARLELAKPNPDRSREYLGLLEGRNNAADIPGMIALFERFGRISYIAQAIADWTAGDALMVRFRQLGARLHAEVQSGRSEAVVDRTLDEIAGVNRQLTVVEDHFSYTLGEGSRWLTALVLKILLCAALTVELSGLILTITLTRGISRRLNALLRAVDRVSRGDYGTTLESRPNDEIGRLAASFNKMTRGVEREQRRAADAIAVSEASLKEARRVAHIGAWDWDFQGDGMSWSKEARRIHQIAPEDFEPSYTGFLRTVHPDDQLRVDHVVHTSRRSGEPFALDYRIALRSAEVRWLCLEATVECDSAGKPVRMLGTTRDITERKLAEERLEYLARHDLLTGLPSRPVLLDRLGQAMETARRNGGFCALLFVDLDRFKRVNDTLGHVAGDRLLTAVGDRLKACLRASDTVARHGGDEFLIAITGLSAAGAAIAARSVMEAFAEPFIVGDHDLFVTASIGISVFPEDGDAVETLIRRADTAMYEAKARGGNNFQFYTAEMHEQAVRRLDLDNKLRSALDNDEFTLLWQPIVSLTSGAICGAEALLRWCLAGGATRHPNEFIEVAEDNGLIVPIGEWAMKAACAQARDWHAMGFGNIRATVNVSARQLNQPNFVPLVSEALKAVDLDPRSLEVEIAESAVMAEAEASDKALRELHEMGVRVSLDAFGTRYSCLNYLKQLPIDGIKIDPSFVRDIGCNTVDRAVAEAIITLCHRLGLHITADGVESRSQFEMLRDLGCDEMQGFYLSPPLEGRSLGNLLRRWSGPEGTQEPFAYAELTG